MDGLEISKGNVPGHTKFLKFAGTTNVDDGVATDIWDGANSTAVSPLWVPPTAARNHSSGRPTRGGDTRWSRSSDRST